MRFEGKLDIGALLLAGVGAFASVQFNAARSGFRPSMESVPAPSAPQQSFQSFRCDGRSHCSQMTSCEEATFFLRNCPGTQMLPFDPGVGCRRAES